MVSGDLHIVKHNSGRWKALRVCRNSHPYEFDDSLKTFVCKDCGYSEQEIKEVFEQDLRDLGDSFG